MCGIVAWSNEEKIMKHITKNTREWDCLVDFGNLYDSYIGKVGHITLARQFNEFEQKYKDMPAAMGMMEGLERVILKEGRKNGNKQK